MQQIRHELLNSYIEICHSYRVSKYKTKLEYSSPFLLTKWLIFVNFLILFLSKSPYNASGKEKYHES